MNKKKVLIISSIIFVAVILILYFVVAFVVPVHRFRKRTKNLQKYVVEIKKDSFTKVEYRLEMEVGEYQQLRDKLLGNGWYVVDQYVDKDFLGYRDYYAVPLGVSDNNFHELLNAKIEENRVLIDYIAYIGIELIPFVRIK